jgi:hypothetical protein
MPTCYRESKDRTHGHIGTPFNRCAKCGHIICYECTSRHLASGQVMCVECASPFPIRLLHGLRTSLIYAAVGVTWLFSALASLIYKFARFVTKPFQPDGNRPRYEDPRYKFEINWVDYRDKVRFAFILICVAVAIAAFGFLYSEVGGIPRTRVLFAFSATCVFWGILATYLLYFFEPSLPRLVSQIVAYSTSFFLAVLFGIWLINLDVLDSIFTFLGL